MNNSIKKIRLFLLVGIAILIAFRMIVWIQNQPNPELAYSQEYQAGTSNIKGDVDIEKWNSLGPAFEIGANKYGYAVFKNPKEAMNTICREYKKGIRALQKEGAPIGLWAFRRHYDAYTGYSPINSSDQEAIRQAIIVEGFVDIYENSFE